MKTIPSDAIKVFWWIISDVYHYKRNDYHWEEKTFELVMWKTWTIVIPITKNNKVIITQEIQPGLDRYFSLPWWRVGESETPLENAKHELIEETWYSSRNFKFLWIHTWRWRIRYEEHVYVARGCIKTQDQSLDWWENVNIILVSFDEFLNLCREDTFYPSIELKIMMYESLLNKKKYLEFEKMLFW